MYLPLAINYADSASLAHSGRDQCLKSSPRFFLSLQMLHNFESQSQILSLPGRPLDQTGFALCWTAKPFPVLSLCVHSAWSPPPFLSFSRGSKLQDQVRFIFPWHQTQAEMLSDGFTVILMETPEWMRSFLLGSCSLEMQWFYDKRSEFQKGEFWKWFGYNFIF